MCSVVVVVGGGGREMILQSFGGILFIDEVRAVM
jgi:hypothetical protein